MSDGGSPPPGGSSPDRGRWWWLQRAAFPLVIAAITVGSAWLGAAWSSADTRELIEAENARTAVEFQHNQRQEHYASILTRVTALQNASDFTTSAIASGVAGGYRFGYGNYSAGGFFGGAQPGPPQAGNSWQDAYTALDQAISSSEIAGAADVLNLARALRDKYRDVYYEAVLARIDDAVIATYPDPKPSRPQLADLLVGVPRSTEQTYDPALLRRPVEELRRSFVDAATKNLESGG